MNKLHKPKTKKKKEKNMKEKKERTCERKTTHQPRVRLKMHHWPITIWLTKSHNIRQFKTVLDPGGCSTNIWVEVCRWWFETLTLFRTRKFLKYILCLGQTLNFITLLRTDWRKIIYPVKDREDQNHTLSRDTSKYRSCKEVPPGLGF